MNALNDSAEEHRVRVMNAWATAKEIYSTEFEQVMYLAAALHFMHRDPLNQEIKRLQVELTEKNYRIEELEIKIDALTSK